MNHLLLITLVRLMTSKHGITQKTFQCHVKYYNLHHRFLDNPNFGRKGKMSKRLILVHIDF
jgi:hypothetical protein